MNMPTPDAEFVGNMEVRVYFNGRIFRILKTMNANEWDVIRHSNEQVHTSLFTSEYPEEGLAWIAENCGNQSV